MPASAIHAEHLAFSYADDSFSMRLPQFAVAPGEAVTLTGPSGCGKSTLLRLLTGLLPPDSGTIRLGDQAITETRRAWLRDFRLRKIGLVFQDFALLEYLTVEENVLLPLRLGGLTAPDAAGRAREFAARLGIEVHWRKITWALSQGERQRVAIVRALAHAPEFIFADEPTASLDPARSDAATRLLIEDARSRGAPLVIVTHDAAQHRLFDRVVDFPSLLA